MISINIAIAFLLLPQVFAGLIHKERTSSSYLSGDELAAYQSRLATYRIRQAAIVYHYDIGEDERQHFDLLNDLECDDRILEAAISFHRHDKGLHLQRDPRLVIQQDDSFNDQETNPLPRNPSDLQEEHLRNNSVLPSLALGFHQGHHFMTIATTTSALFVLRTPRISMAVWKMEKAQIVLLRSDYHDLKESGFDVLTTFDQHPPQMMVASNHTVILPSYSDPAAGFGQGHLMLVDADSNDDELISLRPLGCKNHVASICGDANNDDANTDDEAANRDTFDELGVASTTSDLSANHFQDVQRFVSLLDMSGSDNGVIIAHLELQRSLVTTKQAGAAIIMTVRNCCFIVAGVDSDHSIRLARPCHVLRRIKGIIFYCGCPLANELANNADLFATLSGLPFQQRNFDEISMLPVHQADDLIPIISCCTVIGDAAIHLRSDVKIARDDDDDDIITQIFYHCCSCASGEEFAHIAPIITQPVAPAPAPTATPPPLDPLIITSSSQRSGESSQRSYRPRSCSPGFAYNKSSLFYCLEHSCVLPQAHQSRFGNHRYELTDYGSPSSSHSFSRKVIPA